MAAPKPDSQSEFKSGLSFLGLGHGGDTIARLEDYLAELERWNRRYHFIKADRDELIRLHLLDALAGWKLLLNYVPAGAVLDFGSGAGFPGLPLAFFMPGHRFVLCERRANEVAFLKAMSLLLKLANVTVIRDLAAWEKNYFQAVVFRAVTSIKEIFPIVRPYLAPGGVLFAYKGKREKIDAEIEEIAGSKNKTWVHKLEVPGVDRERHIVVVEVS